MIAILGGLGAAVSWAVATLCSSRSSRMIGASSVLAWVMLVGLAVSIVPAILAIPTAPPLEAWHVGGFLIYGISATAGLLIAYRALSIGRVSIVAPITSTEGAMAALIAVALGEAIQLQVAVLLGLIAVGIVLAAMERSADPAPGSPEDIRTHDPTRNRQAVLLAIAAAAAFSVGLVASARLGGSVPIAWIIAGSRVVGVVAIAVPLILRGGLRLTRRAAPLVAIAGLLEVAGGVLYVVAAQDGIATAAVLGSQFAAMAAVGAFILFGERLGRVQVAGVAVIAIGVATLAYLQA